MSNSLSVLRVQAGCRCLALAEHLRVSAKVCVCLAEAPKLEYLLVDACHAVYYWLES